MEKKTVEISTEQWNRMLDYAYDRGFVIGLLKLANSGYCTAEQVLIRLKEHFPKDEVKAYPEREKFSKYF